MMGTSFVSYPVVGLLIWGLGGGSGSFGVAGQGTDLGPVTTRVDVQTFADLSQDISTIQQYIDQNQPAEGLGVFRDGMHSEVSPGVKRSFLSLANDMKTADPKSPSYLFHLYGQADRALNLAFDTDKLDYIGNQIEQIFTTQPRFAVEAIWILDMWMYATHVLYDGVYQCQQRSRPDANPDLFPIGTAGFDKFIALWYGSGQTLAAENGDGLYKWTQALGNQFGTADPEAQVNTRVNLLYQEAVSIISVEGACTSSNPGSADRLWQLAVNVEQEMTKPLIQGWIYYMQQNDPDGVDVYSKALVPQLAKCRPSLYKKLYESFITGTFTNDPSFLTEIYNLVPDVTYCFGYSCSELGNTGIDACQTHDVFKPTMAGYKPLTPVGNVAAADLDVYQIKILASLKANTFAHLMYMNGANIQKFRTNDNDPLEYVSVHDIAVSSERSSAQPFFDIFVNYNNEKNYGDVVITEALTDKSKWAASQQIAEIVSTTASYQVLFLEAVTKLEIAVEECKEAVENGDPVVNPTLNPIDEAAALLIGSMEGAKLGGSEDLEDGQLVYHMANQHAFQFDTMNQYLYANSVAVLEDLLFAARGQLDALDCNDLEVTTESILKYAMVGIYQGCIASAVINQDLDELSTSKTLAEAEGLSLSILPLIHNANPELATSIERNMIRQSGEEPVPDGGEAVGKMFGQGFTGALLLHCSNLGSLPTVNPCEGVVCPECTGPVTKAGGSGASKRWTTTLMGGALVVSTAVWVGI